MVERTLVTQLLVHLQTRPPSSSVNTLSPTILNSETLSLDEYTSEEENPTLEPLIPQQVIEENLEQHSEPTDLGEEDPVANLSQHFDQSLHLKDQPQSSPFDHHQPLPPLVQMSNQPTATAVTAIITRMTQQLQWII